MWRSKFDGVIDQAQDESFQPPGITRDNDVVGRLAGQTDEVIATVPFSFIAGHSRMPAGEYTVTVISHDMSVWAITSVDGRQTALISTITASPSPKPTSPELVFDKFANNYFLARVVADGGVEREIPLKPTKMEREIIKVALK